VGTKKEVWSGTEKSLETSRARDRSAQELVWMNLIIGWALRTVQSETPGLVLGDDSIGGRVSLT
jgi:hypothetical protein